MSRRDEGRYGVDPRYLEGQKDVISYVLDISDRIRARESSLQIGHTAIEDGNLIVRNGDIQVVETDGTKVLEILHGSVPEIRMYPLGATDTHQAAIFGFDFDLGLGADQGIQISIEDITGVSPVQDGGKLLLTRDYAILSHQGITGEETYFWLNTDTSVAEIISFRGRFRNQWQYDTHQAIYTGDFTATSGFTTWTHSYSASFASKAVPVFTVGAAGTTLQWGIESYSVSSFTIRFSTTANNKLVTFIVLRTD